MDIKPKFELERGERLSRAQPRQEADTVWFLVRYAGGERWRSDDGRCEVFQRPGRRSYVARVDGQLLTRKFNGPAGTSLTENRTFLSLALAMTAARANVKDLTA